MLVFFVNVVKNESEFAKNSLLFEIFYFIHITITFVVKNVWKS